MAYASSLRRLHDGRRWQLARRDDECSLSYLAKTRPVGWSLDEARAALAAIRCAASTPDLRGAISKLEAWVARYEPNILECLQCGYCWRCPLPCGTVPKRCQMCGGYAEVEGETMIVPSQASPRETEEETP